MENKYSKSKVYKLQDNVNFYFYIGSTCNELRKRLQQHKDHSKVKNYLNRKVYVYFNSIGWENVKIILIQEHNLENRQQLLREEDKIIQMNLENEKCLNTRRPFYGLEHKEQQKAYYEDHKDHFLQAGKEYYTKNRENIIEKCKEYRDNNKEKVSDCKKLWYEKNKHNKKYTEKIICECGKKILKVSLKRHLNGFCVLKK